MARWKLIISGRVQTAGYRAMVKNIALGLRVKGVARNLDDGTVEIFCEANAESFERFREAINVKSGPENIFAPSVEEITVYDADSPDYGTPPDEYFKAFKIDYSGIDPEIETLERSEMGIIALGTMNQNIVAMHSDLKDGFSDLKEETKKTHEMLYSIDHRLDDALSRYDLFGKEITIIREDIGDLKKFANEFSEFKDLFALYVKHEMSKDKA